MLPTSRLHHITVTDRDGKQIRGTVVYIQPKKERWREDHAAVHITTHDWIDPYRYEAIYTAPGHSFKGFFMAVSYKSDEKHGWLFKGTFEHVKEWSCGPYRSVVLH